MGGDKQPPSAPREPVSTRGCRPAPHRHHAARLRCQRVQDAAGVHQTFCKTSSGSILPWTRGSRRGRGPGDTQAACWPPHAKPTTIHPCHELGQGSATFASQLVSTTTPLELPDNPSSSCQLPVAPSPVPVAPSPVPAGRMRPAASKANLPALLSSCCKTLRL